MFGIAGAWGIGDAALNSVISTMLSVFFPPDVPGSSTEAAFANMRLWSSLITGLCFFGMPILKHDTAEDTSLKVEFFVPLGMAAVAMVGLVVLWVRGRRKIRTTPGGQPKRGTVGSFQGVFFAIFMSTFITGDALAGVLLGTDKHPSHARVRQLFLVYAAMGVGGFLLVVLFLRDHRSVGGGMATSPSSSKSTLVKKSPSGEDDDVDDGVHDAVN